MLGSFQSLRFLFIMTVFMAHFEYPGVEARSTGIGVVFFFLLSGFLMARNHGQKVCGGQFDNKNFIKRRLVKLYPIHILCLLAWLALSFRILDRVGFETVAANALLLQSWMPDIDWYFSCNSVSWFLSDMIFFIFLFPSIYRKIGKLSKRGLILSATSLLSAYIIYMLVLQCDDLNYWLYIFPPVRLIDFTLGMLMWRACQLWPDACRFRYPSFAEALVCLAAIASYVTYPLDERWHVSFIHWIALVPLILVFWSGERGGGLISNVLNTRLPIWLGGLTMEIFMLHKMVISFIIILFMHAGTVPPYPLLLIICLAAVIFASWCLQKVFVRPVTGRLLKIMTTSK